MSISLVRRAQLHEGRTAIVATDGVFTYRQLSDASCRVAGALLSGKGDMEGERVAFLAPPDFRHVALQWGIWRAGGIAVPLCITHPAPELEYIVADCGASVLVAAPEVADRLQSVAAKRGLAIHLPGDLLAGPETELPEIETARAAMIVYTSGTTGGPKGVVSTHATVRAQIESLVEAWKWSSEDRILLVLPLHHVHGIINVLSCALWSGATCVMARGFQPREVWQRFADADLSLFMAVPTMYAKLVAAWEEASEDERQVWSEASRKLRLMVSGSAALPARLFERWREISGHTLLERYGMTEIGMALSNPLHGERLPGHVGTPLPGVEVRRVGPRGTAVAPEEPGEIEVRGAGVFSEYWGRPEETERAFRHGWFRTGDVAVVEGGSYRILGRQSVDIIKTGGYKVSALEIEEALRQHPGIVECAVVGTPDEEWGERVAAAVVIVEGTDLDLDALRSWAKERLAPYKLPTRLLRLQELPRNRMGKVMKPEIRDRFLGA